MNLAHRFNGMSQEGITEPQRNALAKIDFDHSAFDAIYCSQLTRTIETAKALGMAVTYGGTMDFLTRLESGIEIHGGDEIYGGPNASISTF